MNQLINNKKNVKVVLEIEWAEHNDSVLDSPSTWDWKRIKPVMNLDKVKYLGLHQSVSPENATNWIGN